MKIIYFGGGKRIKTLWEISSLSEFKITQIYIASSEPYSADYVNFAKKRKIKIIQVAKNELIKKFKYYNEDILLSVGFRFILPKEIFSKPKYAINIHPSLLPKYRGAYSGYAIIENGEEETGITAHFIDEGIDTGDIIAQKKIKLTKIDTIKTMTEKILQIEPNFVIKVLKKLKKGDFTLTKQQNFESKIYNKKRRPEDLELDINKSLKELYNKIRACDPDKFPAYFIIDGKKVYIKLEFE